jgi:hypothetical protein
MYTRIVDNHRVLCPYDRITGGAGGRYIMIIKIGRMPGRIQEVALAPRGAKVADALSAAEITLAANEEMKIAGETVTGTTALSDGDVVLVVAKIKGNSGLLVKVGRMPGRITEVALASGAKVSDALNAADITPAANEEVKIAGETADLTDEVDDGDVILVVAKIKGN